MPPRSNPRQESSCAVPPPDSHVPRALDVQDILEVALSFLNLKSPAQLYTLGAVSTFWSRATQNAAGVQGRAILPIRRLRQSIDAVVGGDGDNQSDAFSAELLDELETLEKVLTGVRRMKEATWQNKAAHQHLHAFATTLPSGLTGITTEAQRKHALVLASEVKILECRVDDIEIKSGCTDRFTFARFALGDSVEFLLSTQANEMIGMMRSVKLGFKFRTVHDRLLPMFDTSKHTSLGWGRKNQWADAEILCSEGEQCHPEIDFDDDGADELKEVFTDESEPTLYNSPVGEALRCLDKKIVADIIRIISYSVREDEHQDNLCIGDEMMSLLEKEATRRREEERKKVAKAPTVVKKKKK